MRRAFPLLLALFLAWALYLAVVAPVRSEYIAFVDPGQGKAGTVVRIVGGVACGHNYQIYWDAVASANLLAQGKSNCSGVYEIIIPEASNGKHRIIMRDVDLGGEEGADFTVLPLVNLGPRTGPVGTTATVTGSGFGAGETDIKILYDGASVKGGISADVKGRISAVFPIPESSRGEHVITISGSVTGAGAVGQIKFTVTPKISLDGASGGIGSTVTIIGAGFASLETDIKITFDGAPVKTEIAADKDGSFRTSFTVPAAVRGEHNIAASGASTRTPQINTVIFTVGPSLMVQPTSGYAEDKITITGSGFLTNEPGIKVLFDGAPVTGDVTADSNGAWRATFSLPSVTGGSHPLTARGMSTAPELVSTFNFTVLPRLTISPDSGAVGTAVVLTGTGFGKSQPLTLMYDEMRLMPESATDARGSFSTTFKAPMAFGEKHDVSAKDLSGNRLVVIFTTEKEPPPVPAAESPVNIRIGFVGKQQIEFKWSEVSDPSGVSYTLELSSERDFKSQLLRLKDLIKPLYSLSKEESLEHGDYFWRVKAVDGAGNESDWSEPQLFSIDMLETNMFFIILGIAGVLVMLIVWRIIAIHRQGGWFNE